MAQSKFFTGKLYARMADDLHLGGMSERTHAGYLRAVRQLVDYCQTPPGKITEDQLRRYFLYLKNEKKFRPPDLGLGSDGHASDVSLCVARVYAILSGGGFIFVSGK